MLRRPALHLLAAPIAALALGACAPADPVSGNGPSEGPSEPGGGETMLADLEPGWNEILPGGDTICSQGTEFRFFARPADADRVVVYLQGGGACWDARTCDVEGDPTYSPTADERDDPARRPAGIFDLDHPDNPVADWSMVFVPYCTGDVHVGDATATYTARGDDAGEREFTIHHRGYANVTAVLDWVGERFEEPTEILVAGSSAGSIPSPLYAQVLADRYPGVRVTSMADASGSYRRDPEGDDPSDSWNMLEVVQRHPGYEEYTAEQIDFRHFTMVAGRRHPELTLLQFDAVNDAVQQFYVDLASESPEPVRSSIDANLAEIRAEVPNFHAYLAGGPEHTILHRSAFYAYELDGVRFRDWFARALSGEPVTDVTCTRCDRPQLHPGESDLEILRLAAAKLAAPASWGREESRTCEAETGAPVTLRCALIAATREVLGALDPDAPALLEVRFAALERLDGDLPERADPLVAFNAHPDTSFEDVRALLEDAISDAEAHSHD